MRRGGPVSLRRAGRPGPRPTDRKDVDSGVAICMLADDSLFWLRCDRHLAHGFVTNYLRGLQLYRSGGGNSVRTARGACAPDDRRASKSEMGNG